jgi:hypothetical protein
MKTGSKEREMLNGISKDEASEVLFTNLIMELSASAMLAMGKIANPQTGKMEMNLEMAQIMIETLAVLEEKTKGNLTEKETTVLSTTLTNLRLTYVHEMDKAKPKPAGNASQSA